MYNPSYENFGAPQGWRCPICNRVYSPSTPMCFYCSNKETTISTTNTSGIIDKLSAAPATAGELSWREWLDIMRANNWRYDNYGG